MYFVIGMICLALGAALLWVAFHDIRNMLNGEKPTPTNIIGLVIGGGKAQ